jgi:Pyruvate/2-oxoacid:ferredoxin oxidoreductase gamma subunit
MPKGAITVRLHSVGGWGAITTGKNLAMTLYELLGYHIKANPKYGSEKKGQPDHLLPVRRAGAIRINCEYFYVDVVLSPDPNVFTTLQPALAGLKKGGVFIIQSDLDRPRPRCGPASRTTSAADRRQRHPRLLPRRLQDRARGGLRRAAAAHAGHRLPGRLLRRLAR